VPFYLRLCLHHWDASRASDPRTNSEALCHDAQCPVNGAVPLPCRTVLVVWHTGEYDDAYSGFDDHSQLFGALGHPSTP